MVEKCLGNVAEQARVLAGPATLPSVRRRGFDRMRTDCTLEAMTAYLDAIGTLL